MADLIESCPSPGKAEGRVLPPLAMARPPSQSLNRSTLKKGTTDSESRPSSIPSQDSRPGTVRSKMESRFASSSSQMTFVWPEGSRFNRTLGHLPGSEDIVYDRTSELKEAAGIMHSEADRQLEQYSEIYDALSAQEERYEEVTLENCKMSEAVLDTIMQVREARRRLHAKEAILCTNRQANLDKKAEDTAALSKLRLNEKWMISKHNKFLMQREVARLEKQLLTWRRSADQEFQAATGQADKALQEEQRLDTLVQQLEASITDRQTKVASEDKAVKELRDKPDEDAGPFGWFVDNEDGSILSGLKR